jgi:hypothetical protein
MAILVVMTFGRVDTFGAMLQVIGGMTMVVTGMALRDRRGLVASDDARTAKNDRDESDDRSHGDSPSGWNAAALACRDLRPALWTTASTPVNRQRKHFRQAGLSSFPGND